MSRRLLLLLVLLIVSLAAGWGGAARADGCPASTCGTTSATIPGSRLLFLRLNGQTGPLAVYDVVTGAERFQLPEGLLSADRRRFFSIERGTDTKVTRFDAHTGAMRATWVVRGHWTLGAVNATGSRVVFAQQPGRSLRLQLMNGDRGSARSTVTLPGSYEVETLSPDATHIFVIHHLSRNDPTKYTLQVYDVATHALRADPIKSSDPDVQKMTGLPWGALASRGGRWLLTLYLNPNTNVAFIHALDLRAGVPHCIDLPNDAQLPALGEYAFVLSRDGRTLYAANPLMGRVLTIDLRALRIVHTARFGAIPTSQYTFGTGPNGALTPNGRTLFFSTSTRLWAYDTSARTVHLVRRLHFVAAGLGVTPDGKRVTIVAPGQASTQVAIRR